MSDDVDPPDEVQPDDHGTNLVPLLGLIGATVALGVFVNWWLVAVIVALLASILLHEAGHFFVSRWSGMKATEFFLGMGPRLWSFRRGETTYGVKAAPVGAYVRIIGMSNLEDVADDDEPRTYRAQSYPRRLATVLAGPAANLVLAFVVLYAVVVVEGPVPVTDENPGDGWVVGAVVAGSAAGDAGVEPGDEVVSLDGVDIGSWDDFGPVVDGVVGREVDLVVRRRGELVELPVAVGWSLDTAAAAAIPSSPDLERGTRVLAVDDDVLGSYDELRRALAELDEPVTLLLGAGLRSYELEVTSPVSLPQDGARGFLGLGPDIPERTVGPLGAVGETAATLGAIGLGTIDALGELFTPSGMASYTGLVVDSTTEGSDAGRTDEPRLQVVTETGGREAVIEVSGDPRPISILGIVRIGGDVGAERGIAALAVVLASVNLVLALINLAPLLPFDGGHAAVATYEAVRGALRRAPYRVDMAKLMPVTYAVVALLMFVGLTSIWIDLRNPIELP